MSPKPKAAKAAAPTAVRAAYFYKTRWGTHDEFVELFVRNHWPLLRAQKETGRILDVVMEVPRFHGDGRADWDVMVTITWRDWAAVQEHSDPAIAERLFPDQEAYWAEERHRFSLLEAHWDTPLESVPLPAAEVARRPR